MTYDSAEELGRRYGPSYRWLVTVTGMIGIIAMVLAMTTVNVAVPDVMGAFGIGQDQAQWMSSAYMATMTAGMLINAWLTGILGERRVFVGALFFFSLGALMGGTAPTEHWLILSRVLQGFSAGVAQPPMTAPTENSACAAMNTRRSPATPTSQEFSSMPAVIDAM